MDEDDDRNIGDGSQLEDNDVDANDKNQNLEDDVIMFDTDPSATGITLNEVNVVDEDVEVDIDTSFTFSNEDIKKYTTTSLISLLLLHAMSKLSKVIEDESTEIDWSSIYNHFIYKLKQLNEISQFFINNTQLQTIEQNIMTAKHCEIYYNKLKSIYSKDNFKDLESIIKESLVTEIKKCICDLEININNLQEEIKSRDDSKLSSLSLDNIDDTNLEQSTPSNNSSVEDGPTSPVSTTTTTSTTSSAPVATPVKVKTETDSEDKQRAAQQEDEKNTKIIMSSLQKVWKALNSHRYASIFRFPITQDEAPDYDEFIKHRMDLTTLKKNLDDGMYSNSSEFNTDLQLIFSNAMEYNAPNSEIYNYAVSMKKYTDKEMDMILTTENLLYNTGTTPLRSSRSSTTTPATPSPSIRGRKSVSTSTTPTRSSNKRDSAPSTPTNDDADEAKTPQIEESPSPQAKPKANRRGRNVKPAPVTPAEQKKTTKRQRTSRTEEKSTVSSDES